VSDNCDCGSSLPCDGCDELSRALDSAAADNERLKAAFEKMRSKLQERTLQHRVQHENALRLMDDNYRLRSLLKQAHPSVCSIECLAHWKTDEGQKHSELCKEIAKVWGVRQ